MIYRKLKYFCSLVIITLSWAQKDVSFRQNFTPTKYHWIFAGLATLAFLGSLVWSYKKDREKTPEYYSSAIKVFVFIIFFIILLVLLKFRGIV